jgi:hypothetical protein
MPTKPSTTRRKSKGTGKLSERAFGPAADEFGKEVAPLGREAGAIALTAGRLLLGVVGGTVYGMEQVGNWLKGAVGERLSKVPSEKIVPPESRIAIPTVQAMIYSINEEAVREMFANLLAADMNSDTKSSVHPAFVEIIKQMAPADTRMLKEVGWRFVRRHIRHNSNDVWDVEADADAKVALHNLSRIGLIEVALDKTITGVIQGVNITLTPMGYAFVKVCLPEQHARMFKAST